MDTQTIDGNKLIADFMGWNHHEDEAYDEYEMGKLKYHSSWDWLIPVVDKCSRLDDKDYSGGMFKVELWMFITNDIGSVCEAVINFIKWHNQTPQHLT